MSEVTQVTGQARPPPREEHSTLWVPEQKTWALSPNPAGPPTLAAHPALGADDGHAQCHRGRSM